MHAVGVKTPQIILKTFETLQCAYPNKYPIKIFFIFPQEILQNEFF